jgi:hypothetical protein
MKHTIIAFFISFLVLTSCQNQDMLSGKSKLLLREYVKSTRNGFSYPKYKCNSNESNALYINTSINDLLQLMNHKNSAVKAFAFQSLFYKSYPHLFDLIIKNIESDKKITIPNDVNDNKILLIDFFIDLVNPNNKFNNKWDSLMLNKKQVAILDSMIIFKNVPNESYYKIELLLKIRPRANFYNRIKYLVAKKNPSALVALSRYRNKNDIEIIKKFIFKKDDDFYAIQAIKVFPDKEFFYDLSKKAEKEVKRKYFFKAFLTYHIFQAIVQYKNEEAKLLLLNCLKIANKENDKLIRMDIYDSIHNYPNPIFDDVLKALGSNSFLKAINTIESGND